MRRLFNIPPERETRLWNKYMSNTYEQLNKPDSTVQDAGLFQGQVVKTSTFIFLPSVLDGLSSLFLFSTTTQKAHVLTLPKLLQKPLDL